MVLGLREQLESNQYRNLSFDERLGLLVDCEAETRDSRRLALRLKAAKLRQEGTVEDLDFRTPRGLDRSVLLSLAQASWVAAHQLITGPTGAGKSFVACALTYAAIRRGHTALYVRTPRLLAELALSRRDGRYVRRLGQLARIGLLVLDDLLLTPPSVIDKDLLEVIDDRSQVRSTLVVSQLPVEARHPALAGGDPTLADAILDGLVQHAHRLPLTGASMRRRQPPPDTNFGYRRQPPSLLELRESPLYVIHSAFSSRRRPRSTRRRAYCRVLNGNGLSARGRTPKRYG
jgi:DNA replication protein DnaC